jgi:hypothetical protein
MIWQRLLQPTGGFRRRSQSLIVMREVQSCELSAAQ